MGGRQQEGCGEKLKTELEARTAGEEGWLVAAAAAEEEEARPAAVAPTGPTSRASEAPAGSLPPRQRRSSWV